MALFIVSILILTVSKVVFGDCPTGFMRFNENCYAVLQDKVTWAEGLRLCQAFRSKLAWVESDEENTFIVGMLSRFHDAIATSEVWLGGTDMLVEGTWIWADSMTPLVYKNFFPGEPNNANQNQHCLAMYRDQGFKWDDNYCDQKLAPLCKSLADDGGQIIG